MPRCATNREVIDDTAFLDAVAANGMAYYDAHLAPRAIAKQIATLILNGDASSVAHAVGC